MVWPDGQWEGQEGLGHFGFFLNWLLSSLSPSGTCSACSEESFVMPQPKVFPVVGHGNSAARDSGHQQKCVVSKCTWHFSSTTQLLSELATCASGRKANEGPPKCCPWSLLTLEGREKISPWCCTKTNTSFVVHTSFLGSRVGYRSSAPAPSIMPGTG